MGPQGFVDLYDYTIYYDVTLEFNEAYIQQSAHVRRCFDAEI